MNRILLVCADMGVRDLLSASLREDSIIAAVNNIEDAQKHLKGFEYDVLLSELVLQADITSPLNHSDWLGLDLIKWTQNHFPNLVNVLIAPELPPKKMTAFARACAQITSKFELLSLADEDCFDNISNTVKESLSNNSKPVVKKCLDIELHIKKEPPIWAYTLIGTGFQYRVDGDLKIDPDLFNDLIRSSNNVGKLQDWPDWEDNFKSVGEKILNDIFKYDADFYSDVKDGIGRAGGIQNSRLRFILHGELHPIAFEAVLNPVMDDNYWALNAPLTRRIASFRGTRPALFCNKDNLNDAINCLIIESNVEGQVEELIDPRTKEALYLENVRNIEEECRNIKTYLENNKDKFSINKIEVLTKADADKENKPFSEYVEETMLRGDIEWHIVHYAGHSYYDFDRGMGYVFFKDKYIKPIPITEFSGWIRHAKFVYLSSCKSSEPKFVFDLAARSIPAVLGYRWDINDKHAAEHADYFYRKLFEKKSLEEAYVSTRKYSYSCHKEERSWASPILLMQN